MSTGSLTWRAVLDDVRARLAAAGVENAGQEARWLAEAAAGCAPGGLASGLGGPVEDAVAGRLAGLVERRVAGEPLQYVVGRWGFRRLELAVDPRVLIPRPETEVLAGLALEACDRLGARVVADLGTGSGALALTLATERADLQVWATDVSGEALEVAEANRGAPEWLARPGELLVEMAPHQTQRAAQLARDAGFGDVEIRKDLAGRERVLVARW
jgi:release factor glutamine methyltransferase